MIIPIPKKGDPNKCNNYHTLSLICRSSKILLSIILKRLIPRVEEILSDEQSGFRKGRSTVEQVFNCRNIIEKHLDSQNNLFHNFIEFKSDEQSGFRKGRSTVEQVFNCRNIIEKHLDSLKNLFHNFIEFKKAFDRVY